MQAAQSRSPDRALRSRSALFKPGSVGSLPGRYEPTRFVLAGLAVIALNVIVVALLIDGLLYEALLGAVAVPAALVVMRRPQAGILLLAALVPYDGLLVILPLPSAARDWKEVLVLIVLAASFAAPAQARAGARRRLPGWAPAVAGLLALGLVSGAAVGGLQAITGLRIYYFYLLLSWAIWRCPLGGRERDRLVTIFMVNGVITAVYGVAQEAIGAGRLAALGYPYNVTIRFTHGYVRAFSTFPYQSPFGYFLMVVILLGLAAALDNPRRPRNAIFLVSLPVMATGLFFTFERGAWLGLTGGLLYLAVRRYRIMLFAVPLLALGLAFIPASARSGSFASSSLTERTTNWQTHVIQVATHPLGHGIGASGAAAAKVAQLQALAAGQSSSSASASGNATYEADDQYLGTAYDLGILGLWFLALLMIAAGRVSHLRARRPGRGEDTLAAATTAVVIGYALGSTVAVIFEMFPMDVIWWLLITTVAAGEPATAAKQIPSEAAGVPA